MKVLANVEGLAVRATIETAGVPQGALVNITGDKTVDIAGDGERVDGFVRVAVKDATEEDGQCTIETKYKSLVEVKAVGGALTAGAIVIAGAPATGNVSTVKAIGAGTFDKPYGVVWKGGAENALIEVLTV